MALVSATKKNHLPNQAGTQLLWCQIFCFVVVGFPRVEISLQSFSNRVNSFGMIPNRITRNMVHQRNPWILVQSGFNSFFDVPWSEWSWILIRIIPKSLLTCAAALTVGIRRVNLSSSGRIDAMLEQPSTASNLTESCSSVARLLNNWTRSDLTNSSSTHFANS